MSDRQEVSTFVEKYFQKGGDPSTASATDALLRLRPSHRSHHRPYTGTSSVTGFHDVTGGEYKTRERIQRAEADARLLAIPTSCRRVAACNLN